jgi:hypothetical protein
MSEKPHVDENTLRTMQELLRQPPKTHDEMKLGATKRGPKPKGKTAMTSAERTKKYRAEREGSPHKTAIEDIAASKKAPTK